MRKHVSAILIASTALIAGAADNAAGANDQAVVERSAGPARAVRIGIDGEHGLDACHTQGVISGQGSVAVRAAPSEAAREVARAEPGLSADLCESVPGWVGIVYRAAGDPERDCGTGTNLPGPRPYAGPCRSGWVPEESFEVTAG